VEGALSDYRAALKMAPGDEALERDLREIEARRAQTMASD
jgi:hypothetical protein